MRLIFLPIVLAAAMGCVGCVQGPLVKVGGGDKPLVDVRIQQGQDNPAPPDKKEK